VTGSRTAALLTTTPSMMAFAGRLARCAELGYCAHTGIHLDQLITFGHREISAQPILVRVDRAAVLDWTEHLRTHFEDWDFRRNSVAAESDHPGLSPSPDVARVTCTAACDGLSWSHPKLRFAALDNCSRAEERQPSWDSQPVRYGVSRPPLSSQSGSSRRTLR